MAGRRARRLLWCALAALPLAACLDDQKAQLAQCHVDFLRVYQSYSNAPATIMGEYFENCMRAAGYRFGSGPGCGSQQTALGNPYCYRPVGRLAQIAYRIDILIDQPVTNGSLN